MENNKGRRNEITKLKWKKRISFLRTQYNVEEPAKLYCYKTTGKPCSCPMCSPYKYDRNEKHKKNFEDDVQ